MIVLKNNVHVSGRVEDPFPDPNGNWIWATIIVGSSLEITIKVPNTMWKNFFDDHKGQDEVTVHGILTKENILEARNISCFRNIFSKYMDESRFQFHGQIQVLKKFDFEPQNRMYLKRLIGITENGIKIPLTVLRKNVPYFEKIQEGDYCNITANYVAADSSNPDGGFWKVDGAPTNVVH